MLIIWTENFQVGYLPQFCC